MPATRISWVQFKVGNGAAASGQFDLGHQANLRQHSVPVMNYCLSVLCKGDFPPNSRHRTFASAAKRIEQTCSCRRTLLSCKSTYGILTMFSILVGEPDMECLTAMLEVTDIEMENCLVGCQWRHFLTIEAVVLFCHASQHAPRMLSASCLYSTTRQPVIYQVHRKVPFSLCTSRPCRSALNVLPN